MNPLPENYEPITERLRGVPFERWTQEDCYEEERALRKDAADCVQKAETEKWLIDVVAPLAAAAPHTPVSELIKQLPEPERTIAHDIVFAKVRWADLPVQRSNRQAWHGRIEQAVATTLNGNQPRFTTDDVLDEALMFGSPDRLAARKYAEKILRAANGRRIEA